MMNENAGPNDNWNALLGSEVILPEQFFAVLGRQTPSQGEQRLVLAILEDAVHCFRKYRGARRPRERRLFCEAEEWLLSDDQTPFSFEHICGVLNLDAAHIREGLQPSSHGQLAQRSAETSEPHPEAASTRAAYPSDGSPARCLHQAGRFGKRMGSTGSMLASKATESSESDGSSFVQFAQLESTSSGRKLPLLGRRGDEVPELPQVVRFLRETRLSEGLDHRSLVSIARAAGYHEVKAGELVFQQGSAAGALYLLRRGRVKLVQGTPEHGQVLLRFVSPGDIFGCLATRPDQSHRVSAIAVRWSQVVVWDSKVVIDLLQSRSLFAINVLRELSVEIQDLRVRYRELATEGTEQRLAQLLLRLTTESGCDARDAEVGMPLSGRDLAEMTGTTPYTVSRILSAWKRAGLVDTGRQWVTVLRPQSLAASMSHPMPEPRLARAVGF